MSEIGAKYDPCHAGDTAGMNGITSKNARLDLHVHISSKVQIKAHQFVS